MAKQAKRGRGMPAVADHEKKLRGTWRRDRTARAWARKRGAAPIPDFTPPVWWSPEMCETFAERVDRAVELHGDWPAERLLDHVEGMARFAGFGHTDEHERFAIGALLAGKTPTAAWDCRPSEIAELRKRIAEDAARELRDARRKSRR